MFSTRIRLGAAAGQAGGDVLRAQRLGERDGCGGGPRVRDVREHRHRGVAGQEEVVEIGRPVHAVELRRVGAARREHREHERGGLGGVLDPRTARDHVVRVHVEDEFRTGQRVLAGRRVRGRGRGEPPSPGPRVRGRLPMRRGRAAGELEGGEGHRHGPGALQEAPAVHAEPPRGVVDGLVRMSSLTFRSRRTLGGRDEFAVGHGSRGEWEVIVVPIPQSAGERADPSH